MSGVLERLIRAAPIPRRGPAADSMATFRQIDGLPPETSFEGHMVAPSLGIRAFGLPEQHMPGFHGVTAYFDPEVLMGSRIYGADTWTPRSGAIISKLDDMYVAEAGMDRPYDYSPNLPLDQSRPLLQRYFAENPIRNAETTVSPTGDRLFAATARQYANIEDAERNLRSRLVSGNQSTIAPFENFPNWVTGLVHRLEPTDWAQRHFPQGSASQRMSVRIAFNNALEDAIDNPLGRKEGPIARDRLDAPARTADRVAIRLPQNERGNWYDYLANELSAPVRYAEAKVEDMVSPNLIRGLTFNPNAGGAEELAHRIAGRIGNVPVAPGLADLPPSVLNRILWSGGAGVAPWMIGLDNAPASQ